MDVSNLACVPWTLKRQEMGLVSCLKHPECRMLHWAGPIGKARIKDAVKWPHSGACLGLEVCIFTWAAKIAENAARLKCFFKGLRCLPRGKMDHFARTGGRVVSHPEGPLPMLWIGVAQHLQWGSRALTTLHLSPSSWPQIRVRRRGKKVLYEGRKDGIE